MNFSFETLANTEFTSNSQQYLKPYDIYKVRLTKIEKTELKGKDGVSTYPVVNIEFTGDSGVFSENLFIPNKEEDFNRGVNDQSHTEYPSRFEKFQYTLMQIVEAINPAGAQFIKDNASKLKSIDDFISVVTNALTNKDTEVFLKLVGQNTGGTWYARLPNSCSIFKSDNKIHPINFISTEESKLFWSSYETTQMNAYKNAKPTPMASVVAETPDVDEDEGTDIDWSKVEL